MLVAGICEKHTSRDNAISRTKSRCIYLKVGIFRYTIYNVHLLFDEDLFAQSIPVTMILPRITSIYDQVKEYAYLGIVSLTFARHSMKEKFSLTVDTILDYIIRNPYDPDAME